MTLINKFWYRKNRFAWLLVPFSLVFQLIVYLRRYFYTLHSPPPNSVPVIVVGNITVGGTGKTPVVIALAKFLTSLGYQPGIISRGYKSHIANYPYLVTPENSAYEVGDEPRLIAIETVCPVVIGPDRNSAIKLLLDSNQCNVILSDDGLQHYALQRDIEIAVIDGERGLGNGWCLPAGPLREPASRLDDIDYIVINGDQGKPNAYTMQLSPTGFKSVNGNEHCELGHFQGKTVHAIAGIGHPQRFYKTLESLGIHLIPHEFPDHHNYHPEELDFEEPYPIIMTSKDAVKCQQFKLNNAWCLDVEAQFSDQSFYEAIQNHLEKIHEQKAT